MAEEAPSGHSFSSDPTNWSVPDHAGIEALVRSSSLRVVAQPAHERYVWTPGREGRVRRAGYEAQLKAILALA